MLSSSASSWENALSVAIQLNGVSVALADIDADQQDDAMVFFDQAASRHSVVMTVLGLPSAASSAFTSRPNRRGESFAWYCPHPRSSGAYHAPAKHPL